MCGPLPPGDRQQGVTHCGNRSEGIISDGGQGYLAGHHPKCGAAMFLFRDGS